MSPAPEGARPRRARALVAALLATLALVALPAAAPAAGGAYSVMSDSEKETKLLEMAADFVPTIESRWIPDGRSATCDDVFDIAETIGTYDACSDGVNEDRGLGSIAYVYATLLAGDTRATSFGNRTREEIADRLEQVLRQIAFTNVMYMRGGWGGPDCSRVSDHCQAGGTNMQLAWAYRTVANDGVAADQFESGGTASAIERVVKTEADLVLNTLEPLSGRTTNSFAEENVWETLGLAGARAALPSDRNADLWVTHMNWYAVASQVREEDNENDEEVVDGHTVAWWTRGTLRNILQRDWTLTNHGFFHPLYSIGVMASLMDAALMLDGTGVTVPESLTFRQQLIWDEVLGQLLLGDGDLMMPAGNDWVTHDYQFIPYLTTMARQGDANTQTVATVMESRAIDKLSQRQDENGGSLYGMPRIGYEIDVMRNLMQAFWLHRYFSATTAPTESEFDAAFAALHGVKVFDSAETIINHTPNATVSLHWFQGGSAYPSLFITPAVHKHLDDPVMSHYWPGGGLGDTSGPVTYTCDCQSSYFSSAGYLSGSDRDFSVTSFDDGSTVLLDRGSGDTFNMLFENDPALWTDPNTRPIFDQNGSQGVGSLSGDWANVDDRFGMVVRGGSGMSVDEFADTQTGKADIDNPMKRLIGATGGTNEDRAALVLPLATRSETARVAADTLQATTSDSGWSALTARTPDNSARIAVGRWSGSQTATISGMTSGWGVPIPDHNADITVNNTTAGSHSSGSFSHTLSSAPASQGWKGYFWVDAIAGSRTGSVTVRPQSESRIKLTNGGTATTVTVRYTDGSGAVRADTWSLSANQAAIVHADDDDVQIVLPSATSTESSSFPAVLAADGKTDSANNWWSSASTTISSGSPQYLTFEYAHDVDMLGVIMTPVSGAGPRDYVVQTSVDGRSWTDRVTETGIGNSAETSTFSAAIKPRFVRLKITAGQSGSPRQVKVRELQIVLPAIDIDATDPHRTGEPDAGQIRLAAGGANWVTVRVRNRTGSSKSVTLSARATSPVSATVGGSNPVSVPANGSVDVSISLSGSTATTGTGLLTVSGTVSGLTVADEPVILLFDDQNLALNDTGTTYPLALASSYDPAWLYLAQLAFDGDTTGGSNFWVSGPADMSRSPQALRVDFGTAINVRRVEMTPRASRYGPKDYQIQTSTNSLCIAGLGFSTASGGTVTNASASSETSTTLSRTVSARCVQILIGSTWGGSGTQQAQVRELQVYPS